MVGPAMTPAEFKAWLTWKDTRGAERRASMWARHAYPPTQWDLARAAATQAALAQAPSPETAS